MDDVSDLKKLYLITGEYLKNSERGQNSSTILDIQRISLYEKQNQLNSTMWLGGNQSTVGDLADITSMGFGILIDSDRDPYTGKQGVDYQLEYQLVKGNSTDDFQKWNKILYEYSSLGQYRIMDVNKNYSGFFGDGRNSNFVLFSMDMDKIHVNPSFRLMYYSLASYSDNTIEIDLSNWINIPQDSFSIFTTPEEIILRQGESKTVGLQIVSSSGKVSSITDLYGLENYTSLNIEMLHQNDGMANSTIGGFYGTEPIQLKLNAPGDANVGKHTIPVSANISFGSNFPSNFINFRNNFEVFIDTKGYELMEGNITVNVLEPLSFHEELRNFWSVYGSIISLIGAGFAGGVSSFFFESIKERRKKRVD
ncbi:MAG: hypothetical protein M3162_09170 [Thermoproteota archaeon]|nr:hypothetical protein [Thermoproteota archaeon]